MIMSNYPDHELFTSGLPIDEILKAEARLSRRMRPANDIGDDWTVVNDHTSGDLCDWLDGAGPPARDLSPVRCYLVRSSHELFYSSPERIAGCVTLPLQGRGERFNMTVDALQRRLTMGLPFRSARGAHNRPCSRRSSTESLGTEGLI